jgi:hypothetical protein
MNPIPASHLQRRMLRLLAASLLLTSVIGRTGQLDSGGFKPVIQEQDGQTLFAFDNLSIPFTRSLKVTMHAPEKYEQNPVLGRGQPGEADSYAIHFYGSIIRVGDKFRMWYVGTGDERGQNSQHDSSLWRALYAESTDGIHWIKPKLGLVDYRGSKDNNILKLDPFIGTINVKVLHEPEDPDPARRYKMVTHVYWLKGGEKRHGTMANYFSADGLTWKLTTDAQPTAFAEMPEDNNVLSPVHFEPAGGLYKWDGAYYSSGQNPIPATRPYVSRIARAYRSYDFVKWEPTTAVSFVRTSQYLPDWQKSSNEGQQTHEGVSVWNRGNVLLGMYGMWEGGSREFKDIIINQGFVISNDGIHFREPAHEFAFLKVGPDGTWDEGGLMQGQGFENIGDKTCIYYGSGDLRTWTGYKKPIPPRGSVGLATLPRDRFADLRVFDTGEGPSEFVTAPLQAKTGADQRLYVNADGLGSEASLKIELLSYDEKPLPGYSGADAAVITQSGFQVPVAWKGREAITGLPERYRIRATFDGAQKESIRFSAFYVQPAKSR